MLRIVFVSIIALSIILSISALTEAQKKLTGKEMFVKYCSGCHHDGGNRLNPAKTLSKKDREANNVKTAQDIINLMRNPGTGMQRFTEQDISDQDAKKIAEYIMKTFK